jgi:archaellum component FlaD/FlaE
MSVVQLQWIVDVSQLSQDREVALYQAAKISFGMLPYNYVCNTNWCLNLFPCVYAVAAVSMDTEALLLPGDEIPMNPNWLSLDGFPHSDMVILNASSDPNTPDRHSITGEFDHDDEEEEDDEEDDETDENRESSTTASSNNSKQKHHKKVEEEISEQQEVAVKTPARQQQLESQAQTLAQAQAEARTPLAAHTSFVELDSDDDSPMHFALNASLNASKNIYISPLMASTITEETTTDIQDEQSMDRGNDDSSIIIYISGISLLGDGQTPVPVIDNSHLLDAMSGDDVDGKQQEEEEDDVMIEFRNAHSSRLSVADSDDETPIKQPLHQSQPAENDSTTEVGTNRDKHLSYIPGHNASVLADTVVPQQPQSATQTEEPMGPATATVEAVQTNDANIPATSARKPFLSRLFQSTPKKTDSVAPTAPPMTPPQQVSSLSSSSSSSSAVLSTPTTAATANVPGPPASTPDSNSGTPKRSVFGGLLRRGSNADQVVAPSISTASSLSKAAEKPPLPANNSSGSGKIRHKSPRKPGYRVFQYLSASQRAINKRVYEFPTEQCPWYATRSLQLSENFDVEVWGKQRMKHCEAQSKLFQQKIIHVSRALENAKLNLALATDRLTHAKVSSTDIFHLKTASNRYLFLGYGRSCV